MAQTAVDKVHARMVMEWGRNLPEDNWPETLELEPELFEQFRLEWLLSKAVEHETFKNVQPSAFYELETSDTLVYGKTRIVKKAGSDSPNPFLNPEPGPTDTESR